MGVLQGSGGGGELMCLWGEVTVWGRGYGRRILQVAMGDLGGMCVLDEVPCSLQCQEARGRGRRLGNLGGSRCPE